ncbi:RDD family protein [Lysobacter korlensis]|uniref:RDD family protein n=1 Tax=Lysobacter korlensis TaxID=553636 RepID=A0ABV6S370_9GAMM
MSENWFYQAGGKARASTLDGLIGLMRNGLIDSHTPVWQEGFANWKPLGEALPEIAGSGAAVPPPHMPPVDRPARLPHEDPFRSESVTAAASPALPKLAVEDDGWQDTSPHPWRRYFARMIDITVFSASVGLLLGSVLATVAPALHEKIFYDMIGDNRAADAIFSTLIVVPVLALLTGLFGTSLGKFFMGVRLTLLDGRPIGVPAAFGREFSVYFRGLGLGIPLVVLLTLVSSHNRLKTDGVAPWDRDRPWVVTYRPDGAVQVLLVITGLVIWAAVFGFILTL